MRTVGGYLLQGFGAVLAGLGFLSDCSSGQSVYNQYADFPASLIAWGIGVGGVALFILGQRLRAAPAPPPSRVPRDEGV